MSGMDELITRPAVYVVATPIGNLGDLTERARYILAGVDVIAAEDTRQTRKLLSHLGIQGKELVAYHDHNEAAIAPHLLNRIQDEKLALALVSDAGTPAIADPGYRLVAQAHERTLPVHPIPGASALTALASASGLPTDRILFVGFLPVKTSAITKEMQSWQTARASIVFYESPRRLRKSLAILADVYPQAEIALGRELTKLHEEIVRIPVTAWEAWVRSSTLKGEAVIMVDLRLSEERAELSLETLQGEAAKRFREGARLTDLLKEYKEAGWKRSEIYQMLLSAKDDSGT